MSVKLSEEIRSIGGALSPLNKRLLINDDLNSVILSKKRNMIESKANDEDFTEVINQVQSES